MDLRERIRQLPASPGVYLMLDASGGIIYVGKARNLRQRVRTYFGSSGDGRHHVKFLLARVADIQVMLTDTEKEALLLENTLIKQHHPRYNLSLKDDKTYFSLRLDPREEFPRFKVVRKVPRDGARYFGPYASASAAREVLRQLQRMFPLRHYPLATCRARSRPCLYHQIGQCSAPCKGMISPTDYASLVEGAILFLEGKNRQLTADFKRHMFQASEALNFEEATRWRNLLRSIEVTVEKQKMVTRGGDSDAIGLARHGSHLAIALLFIRGGAVSGSRVYHLNWELDDGEGLHSFLGQHYGESAVVIPDEILLPLEMEDSTALEELLGESRGRRMKIFRPVRGTKRELVELASRNAAAALQEQEEQRNSAEAVLEELRRRLHLNALPKRMECYDISTIQGRFSVGSRAVFSDGRPDRQRYRHYRIRGVAGQDDFAMLAEVFARRFRPETVAGDGLPDLVVVDGGIGQLNAVRAILFDLGLEGRFDIVSLAKSRVQGDMTEGTLTRSDERVFLPGRLNPVVLRQNSAPLLLLAALRDEAHRFAITYHRSLRGKGSSRSSIEGVPGIGPKRRTTLLRRFGSIKGLRAATLEEIASVEGVSRSSAEVLYRWLHPAGLPDPPAGEEQP